MDEGVEQKGSDSDSNIFRSFVLKQLAGSIPHMERDGSPRSEMSMGGDHVRDSFHLPNLQPWSYTMENSQSSGLSRNTEQHFLGKRGHDSNGSINFSHVDSYPSCLKLSDRRSRNRSYLRSRSSQRLSAKLVSSIDNCLIPQLYNDHFEFEEYIFSVNSPSNVANERPFVVANGNSVIGKPSTKPWLMSCVNELDVNTDVFSTGSVEPVIGIAPLSDSRKWRCHSKKLQQGVSGTSGIMDSEFIPASRDPPKHMLLYCLGVAIGAKLVVKSNTRELDELNNLLQVSENFVRDLQDELQFKQSLTVIELCNESYEKKSYETGCVTLEDVSSALNEHSSSDFSEEGTHVKHQLQLPKNVENLGALSQIEEELKAELEMLELNMNGSIVERKFSLLNKELNAKVNGNITADAFRHLTPYNPISISMDNKNASTTETHDIEETVSPRELSLHLLEVNQHRLEEQIKELERALDENEKKLHLWEQQNFLNSDVGSSCDRESSIFLAKDNI